MPRFTKSKKKKNLPPLRMQKVTAAVPTKLPAKRMQWTRVQMDAAINSVLSGSAVSINRAARDHGIPPTTLKDRLSGRVVDGTKPGRVSYLSSEEETELETYLTEVNEIGYGKTRREVKVIAEKVAAEKGVLRGSRISDGWWRRFLERHPKLSLRSGDATGHVRMDAMNKENLLNYFDLLKNCIEENGLKSHPECIYNMDESGLPLDPKPPKVVAVRGQRKVRYHCSGVKSQITVLGCCSATGQALPPFIIFQGKHLNYQWTLGEIPGTRYGTSESGWTDRDLFRGWLKEHFLTHSVSGRPLLLLVDGHSSHYDPDTIRYAKDHDVIIFCLPPHTTHEAQPLDISFFGPLKTNWREVCHKFLQSNPGKAITKYNFVQLFVKAWLKTCLPETICSGFRRAGIVPFCPDVLLKRCPGSKDSVELDKDVRESPASQHTSTETLDKTDEIETLAIKESFSDNSTFSPEKEALYCRRFEEGYDLFDEDYKLWLRINHPEVLESVVDHFLDIDPILPNVADSPLGSANVTPNRAHHTSSLSLSFETIPSKSLELSLPVNTVPISSSPLVNSIPETPPSDSGSQSTPTRKRSPLSDIGNRCGNHVSTSPLSQHLTPILSKPTKTGHARVLTSTECIELLEEKRREKEQKAEEKEARKRERKRKKAEREELQQTKKKERLERQQQKKKAALKKKMDTAARKKVVLAGKSAGTRSSSRGCKVPPPQTASSTVANSVMCPPSSSSGSVQGSSAAEEPALEEVCECAFCFSCYQEDGAVWVKCGCGRWVHDECVEEVVAGNKGEELFCPFCLNM